MLGAIACATGCADFLVSLLSHALNEITPAARITIFRRFNQHPMAAKACPHHTFPLDELSRQRAAIQDKGRIHCPMNRLKRPAKPVELKVTLDEAPPPRLSKSALVTIAV
jgi:hypothetical protein